MLSSCDEQTNKNFGEQTDNPILSDKPTTPLQPSDQKVKLTSVATNLMDKFDEGDFEKISTVTEMFVEKFDDENYDFEPFYNWFEEQLESAYDEGYQKEISNSVVEIKNTTDILILLANHKGHFVFGETGVTVTPYDGIKATCTLDGKNYEAIIEQKGKVTNAIYEFITKEYTQNSSGYYDENGMWVELGNNTDLNRVWKEKVTVGIPESLLISITENGSPLALADVKFIPSFTASGIELTKDSFSTEMTIQVENYELAINRLMYDGANGKAEFSQVLKKNGEALISTNISGDVKLEIATEKNEWANGSYESHYIKATYAKNISASIDILGELQVIGSCSNAIDASKSLDAFWDATDKKDENTAKRHLDNFNAKFDFGVYYDKGNNKQADMEFSFINNPYNPGWDINGDGIVNQDDAYDRYEIIPIIVFNDGSKYSVEEYFTDGSFEDLLEDFEEFCEKFEEIFGYSIDDIK